MLTSRCQATSYVDIIQAAIALGNDTDTTTWIRPADERCRKRF